MGKYRPKEIGAWIKTGRAVEPTIKSAAAFGEQWWQWYLELQPAGRAQEDGSLQRVVLDKAEWSELYKGTINGMYSLLASLAWWLKAANPARTPKVEVSKVLDDVSWVLEAMTRAHSSKRASPEAEEPASKKARIA